MQNLSDVDSMKDCGLAASPLQCPVNSHWAWVQFYRGPLGVVWWRDESVSDGVEELLIAEQRRQLVPASEGKTLIYDLQITISTGAVWPFSRETLEQLQAPRTFGSVCVVGTEVSK